MWKKFLIKLAFDAVCGFIKEKVRQLQMEGRPVRAWLLEFESLCQTIKEKYL